MNTRILDEYDELCRRAREEAELVAQVRELIAYELAREADEAPETVRSARDAYEPLPERPVAVRVVAA